MNRFDSAIDYQSRAFSPSLRAIKGRRNYLKRPFHGSGAVADYSMSPAMTAPLSSHHSSNASVIYNMTGM